MASEPIFVVRAVDSSRDRRRRFLLLLAWLASLAIVAVLTKVLVTHSADHLQAQALADAHKANEGLEARIAMLTRSEQVAKAALSDLQGSLRDRDEEIDGLRADLAFYGRLVGGSQREGLAVHALRVVPVPGSQAWNFTATLTQNFKRGELSSGKLSLAVEGVAGGKLQTLDWKSLSQGENEGGIGYSFKYFQQVRGTMMLPEGFVPNRVVVHVEGDGARADQAFSWADAIKGQETENVSQ